MSCVQSVRATIELHGAMHNFRIGLNSRGIVEIMVSLRVAISVCTATEIALTSIIILSVHVSLVSQQILNIMSHCWFNVGPASQI